MRALLTERERPSTQWEIGSEAEPEGLVELLLERGLVRDSNPVALGTPTGRRPQREMLPLRIAIGEFTVASTDPTSWTDSARWADFRVSRPGSAVAGIDPSQGGTPSGRGPESEIGPTPIEATHTRRAPGRMNH